ncbi:hypothetical protein [Natrarchaeobaculum sulfurireducens]|nr:hypothetical protein [Natrarchaeobaculum sulfurireducens]
MNRILTFSLLAAVALVLAMGMGGEIVAADNATDNATDEDSDVHSILDRTAGENASYSQVEVVDDWYNEEADNLSDDDQQDVEAWLAEAPDPADRLPSEYVRAIDSETHITDWEFRNGEFVVHVHALEETTVTMAESADWEEGSGEYRTMSEDLSEGNNTVYVDTFADESDGVALSFATELSMEEQRGPYISTGSEAADDPFQHFGGTSGLFSGVAMTTLLAALAAGIVVWQEDSGVVKA